MRGVVVLDKPAGVSSSALLGPFRRAFRRRVKVGHAGTLDPFATGTIVALLGDATRLADLALALPKEYEATVRFGETTETLDPESPVLERVDPGPEPPSGWADVLARFVGEIEQEPPVYSAIKVGGTPSYRLARAGKATELRSRRVVVHEIRELDPFGEAPAGSNPAWPDVRLRIRCGAGTYIRSLARDIGAEIGLPAYLVALRRTAVGPFRADEGWKLDPRRSISSADVEPRRLDPLRLLEASRIPTIAVSAADLLRVARGNPVDLSETFASDAGEAGIERDPVGIVGAPGSELPGELVGLGSVDAADRLRPKIVFAGARAALERADGERPSPERANDERPSPERANDEGPSPERANRDGGGTA